MVVFGRPEGHFSMGVREFWDGIIETPNHGRMARVYGMGAWLGVATGHGLPKVSPEPTMNPSMPCG
jgi:hypothetical protein